MDYAYDFGDGWSHRLTVEKVLAPEPGVSYPRCVSGRRACPPELAGLAGRPLPVSAGAPAKAVSAGTSGSAARDAR